MNYDLNNDNYEEIVLRNYDRNKSLVSEFNKDFRRVKYVKGLINKHIHKNILKERLILNHIIILANVFGPEVTVKLLFLRIPKEHYSSLKTFLLYLNYLPEKIKWIKGKVIRPTEIPFDMTIVRKLREL